MRIWRCHIVRKLQWSVFHFNIPKIKFPPIFPCLGRRSEMHERFYRIPGCLRAESKIISPSVPCVTHKREVLWLAQWIQHGENERSIATVPRLSWVMARAEPWSLGALHLWNKCYRIYCMIEHKNKNVPQATIICLQLSPLSRMQLPTTFIFHYMLIYLFFFSDLSTLYNSRGRGEWSNLMRVALKHRHYQQQKQFRAGGNLLFDARSSKSVLGLCGIMQRGVMGE